MDNRNTQNSLASDAPSEWEKFQQNQKKNLQKKYQWLSIALIGVIVTAVLVFILSSYRCQIFGHQWESATCILPQTCSHCEQIEGQPAGHKWVGATCDSPKTCSVCNLTEGAVLSHQWKDATCVDPRICNLCGRQEGSSLGHNWSEATCTIPKTCAICKVTEGDLADHKWSEATRESPATCSACGTTTGTRIMPTLMVTNLSWGGEGHPQYNCTGNNAQLSFPTWSSFASSSIVIENVDNKQVSADSFRFDWQNGTVNITANESLRCGIYNITFTCQNGTATIGKFIEQ